MSESPTPADQGVSRTRGSVLLVLARALTALFNIFSVPIFMAILGKDGYAAIVFAIVVHGLMYTLDFGTGEIVQRQMSVALADGDREEVRRLSADQLSINLFSGAVIILVGILLGLTLSLEGTGLGRPETFLIFAFLGVQCAMFRINIGLTSLLSAYRRFDATSLATAAGGIAVTLFALAAIYLTKQSWTYMAAMLAGEFLSFVLLLRGARRAGVWSPVRPHRDFRRLGPILKLCAVETPNRVGSMIASLGDKLLLGAANAKIELVDYRNAARVPDSLWVMLYGATITSLPKLSRDFAQSKEAFHTSALSTGRMAFFVGGIFLLAPTGLGAPFLAAWLGANAPENGDAVMALIAVYQTFQIYVSIMGYALLAAAKRSYFIPITTANAILSLSLTLPIFYRFGLVGVAWMNFGIALLQGFGIWAILAHLGFPRPAVARHAAQILGMLAVMLGVVMLGRASSSAFFSHQTPWLLLAGAPLAAVLAAIGCLGLRLAVPPEAFTRRWERLRGSRSSEDRSTLP